MGGSLALACTLRVTRSAVRGRRPEVEGLSVAAISQETREAIARDLREKWGPGHSIRVIATEHGVSDATVRRVQRAAGISVERSQIRTKTARESLKESNALRRERLSERLLDEAEKALEDIANGSVITGISWGEIVSGRAKATSARDRRELITAAAIALDKHRMLDTYDQDRDTTEVGKFLRALAGEA
jgi:hypothetical protein